MLNAMLRTLPKIAEETDFPCLNHYHGASREATAALGQFFDIRDAHYATEKAKAQAKLSKKKIPTPEAAHQDEC